MRILLSLEQIYGTKIAERWVTRGGGGEAKCVQATSRYFVTCCSTRPAIPIGFAATVRLALCRRHTVSQVPDCEELAI